MSNKRKNSGSLTTRTGKGSNVGPSGTSLESELTAIIATLEAIDKTVKNIQKQLDKRPKGIPGIHGKGE